uniref:Expressed protein n=1 Tax=Echinococcus granulosus TaxID=6210 RepID=A0A068WQW2_ECHGR|nr:expressed protein [Echinococcus granulosus]
MDMTGQLRSGNRREALPSLTCIKALPPLHNCAFRSLFPHLSMDTHDGQHNSLSLNLVLKSDETLDAVELPRGISDVEVKYLFSYMEL